RGAATLAVTRIHRIMRLYKATSLTCCQVFRWQIMGLPTQCQTTLFRQSPDSNGVEAAERRQHEGEYPKCPDAWSGLQRRQPGEFHNGNDNAEHEHRHHAPRPHTVVKPHGQMEIMRQPGLAEAAQGPVK